MERTFKLKDFDGPLDLLLTLVNKAQIDIRDIFVSEITEQYLEIVRSAPDLDMDEASDFLVVAATLIEIKSRAMLPRPPAAEEGEENPETELIRRLEEYRRFKESTESLRDFEAAARNVFTKLPEEYPLPPQEVELTNLTLDALTEALYRVLARKAEEEGDRPENHYAPRDIHRDEHTVQECMLSILQKLRKNKRIRFEDALSDAPTREEVVTYFLAVLELLKLGRMHAVQNGTYGEIELISGRVEAEEVPEEEPDRFGKKRRKRKKKEAGEESPELGEERTDSEEEGSESGEEDRESGEETSEREESEVEEGKID